MVDPTGTNTTPILPGIDLPALGGDLSSVAGTTTISVVKINGATLGTATATSGNVLIASGTAWNSQALLGDITVTAGGTTTVAAIAGVAPGPAGTATIGQIPGIASATAAVAGNIGEYLSTSLASGSAIVASNNVATSIVGMSLTAGDWDVWGFAFASLGVTTVLKEMQVGVNTSSTALPTATTGRLGQISLGAGLTGGSDTGGGAGPAQFLLSATNTAYLVTTLQFTTSTASVYGSLQARRRR